MSHWSDYETRDVFGNEDNEVNHLLRFQDGEEVLESVPFSDSHKKPRYEATDDVRSTIFYEDSATEAPLPMKDASVLPSAMKEGCSNIHDPSLSLLSEKTAAALGITKCSTGSTILDSLGDKISTKSVRKDENDIVNNTLCSDYGERGDAQNKKFFDFSSADNLVGILTKEQMSGADDLLFLDYPSIGHFEDFDKMFRNRSTFVQGSTVSEDEMSWFSSSSHGFHGVEDTLQSVVLSSVSASSAFNDASSAHGLSTNILPGIKPSTIGTDFPSSTDCNSLPLYSDTGRKGKSLISELAYDHSAIVEKSLMLDQVGYENDCRSPNMIYTTLKELTTTKGKTIIPTFESTLQSSLSCCGLIQNVQDQELLTSFLPTSQLRSLQAISKKAPFSESFTSNCSHSYNPQAQMSNIFKSSELPDYVTSSNLLSYAHHSMGILPGPFPIPSMPMEKNKKIYAGLQFPTEWLIDKPLEQHMEKCLEQHAEESDSSPQRKYKFEDILEGVKEPAVNIGSSTIHDKSCMTDTFIDDVSIKTANFQQLQMIMDRLGVRTKLCIRDSLYRLAKSAEQSHCYGSENNVSRAGSPMRGFQGLKDSNRPSEYLGLPISTNEIERAVAYLLFHKSLGSTTGTADDSICLRTPIHIQDPFGKCKEPNQSTS